MDALVLSICVVTGPLLGHRDPIDRSMKFSFAPDVLDLLCLRIPRADSSSTVHGVRRSRTTPPVIHHSVAAQMLLVFRLTGVIPRAMSESLPGRGCGNDYLGSLLSPMVRRGFHFYPFQTGLGRLREVDVCCMCRSAILKATRIHCSAPAFTTFVPSAA